MITLGDCLTARVQIFGFLTISACDCDNCVVSYTGKSSDMYGWKDSVN